LRDRDTVEQVIRVVDSTTGLADGLEDLEDNVCLYIMNRTQIYLSESQHKALGALAKARSTTASALIRDAIDGYLATQLTPHQRLDALRALGARFAQKPPTSEDSAAFVDDLRRAGMDRLNSRA
jgi:predicted transcriptional regulator